MQTKKKMTIICPQKPWKRERLYLSRNQSTLCENGKRIAASSGLLFQPVQIPLLTKHGIMQMLHQISQSIGNTQTFLKQNL